MKRSTPPKQKLNFYIEQDYNAAVRQLAAKHEANSISAVMHDAIRDYAAKHDIELGDPRLCIRDGAHSRFSGEEQLTLFNPLKNGSELGNSKPFLRLFHF